MTRRTSRANRVLIVDDNPQICAVMVQRLNKEGYETRTATTGFEAGWTTQEFMPDLIFLDIMLPGINGIEVCRQIRSEEKTKSIKIVGMSATEDVEMIRQMREAGVDDFMPKPFALHELKERILKQIGPIQKAPEPVEAKPSRVPAALIVVILLAAAAIVLAMNLFYFDREAHPNMGPTADELKAWADHERSAELSKLVFYEGTWFQRDFLGKGEKVSLKGGETHEGFLQETGGKFFMRTLKNNLWLAPSDMLKRERSRQKYEDYWDRAAAEPANDADGHFALGKWCLEQGLKEPALREFKRALLANPGHAGALKELSGKSQLRSTKSETNSNPK